MNIYCEQLRLFNQKCVDKKILTTSSLEDFERSNKNDFTLRKKIFKGLQNIVYQLSAEEFAEVAFPILFGYEISRVQKEFVKALDEGCNKFCSAQRGEGKTTVLTVWVLYKMIKYPYIRIRYIAGSESLKTATFNMIKKSICNTPMLLCMWPSGENASTGIKSGFYIHQSLKKVLDASANFSAQTINVSPTGLRGHIHIFDDMETSSSVNKPADRLKAETAFKEAFPPLMTPYRFDDDVFDSFTVAIGTPQDSDSFYYRLDGYKMFIVPGRYPTVEQINNDVYHGGLAQFIIDDILLHPELQTGYGVDGTLGRCLYHDIGDEKLCSGVPMHRIPVGEFHRLGEYKHRKESVNMKYYKLQFLLDPSLTDGDTKPLKMSKILFYPLNPGSIPDNFYFQYNKNLAIPDGYFIKGLNLHYSGIGEKFVKPMKVIMTVDPASTASATSKDETSYAVGCLSGGFLILFDCGGFIAKDDEDYSKLGDIAKLWGVHEVYIEGNFGNGAYTKLLAPYITKVHPCVVDEYKVPNTRKETRMIGAIEPWMLRKSLVVNFDLIQKDFDSIHNPIYGSAPYYYSLFYQMSNVKDTKQALVHDDRLDAFHALAWLLSQEVVYTTDELSNLETYDIDYNEFYMYNDMTRR